MRGKREVGGEEVGVSKGGRGGGGGEVEEIFFSYSFLFREPVSSPSSCRKSSIS